MARPTAAPDSTAELLHRFGRRYPTAGRTAVAVLCAAVAPFAAPPAGPGVAAAVSVAVMAWSAVYLPVMHRSAPAWCWGLDVALVCALCLAKPLLVAPELQLASLGWVSPVASFTVVAVQFVLPAGAAAAVTVAICAAFVGGGALTPGVTAVDALAVGGAWMLAEALLARLLWRLVRRGGREADELLRRRFEQERAAATAAARRADQRAHWATLHDTSASTLLMVGLGQVRGDEAWLPGQIERDAAALQRRLDDAGPETDLATGLRDAAGRARVEVALDGADAPASLPADVTAAFTGAVSEALENVHRHAGVAAATVALHRAGDAVTVVVADAGGGFVPEAVGPDRFGLAWSVRDRMDAVGGCAVVSSAPGRGTTVRLEWPGG